MSPLNTMRDLLEVCEQETLFVEHLGWNQEERVEREYRMGTSPTHKWNPQGGQICGGGLRLC